MAKVNPFIEPFFSPLYELSQSSFFRDFEMGDFFELPFDLPFMLWLEMRLGLR